MAETLIRELSRPDIEVVMPLMIQLGYELNITELHERFEVISKATDHAVLGAILDDSIVGFCHIYARPALEKPIEAVVQSLVVDAEERNSGIGRALMAAAEDWARARGHVSLSLYSQTHRKDAHAFYESLGYEDIAQSSLMRKQLTT